METMKFNIPYLKRWANTIFNEGESYNYYDNTKPIDWNIDRFALWFFENVVDDANVANSFTEKVFGVPNGTKLNSMFSQNDGSGFNGDRYWKRFGSSKSALCDVWCALKPKLGGKHNSFDSALSGANESKKPIDNRKLVESAIRKIVKKVLIESEQKYVRFDSHRSRDKAERILGSLPRAKASFRHNGHFYPMDDEQISKLSSIKSGITVVNKLPGNLDDWMNSR